MPCFHPKICNYPLETDSSGKRKLGGFYDVTDRSNYWFLDNIKYIDNSWKSVPIMIPCGKCRGCLMDRSREWADRCALEALSWEHNYFVTLTYNDEHLPLSDISGFPTLVRSDVQNFLKRLRVTFERKYSHSGIRYFGCGEYGTRNGRPHYHLILFNTPLPDLKYFKSNRGIMYYRSELIEKLWPFGFVMVGEVNWQTSAYTARYCLKKRDGVDAQVAYDEVGIARPFTCASKNPGIGAFWYQDNIEEILSKDKVPVKRADGLFQARVPKYFDKLTKRILPDQFEEIRANRLQRYLQDRYIESTLGMSRKQSNRVAEEAKFEEKTNSLLRLL